MRVTIVGLGLIGGSLGLDLRARSFATEVVGVDSLPAHCEKARELSLVDRILPLEDALHETDLVILAVPVNVIARLLPDVLTAAPASVTVTDMGSTKKNLCDAVKNHPLRSRFVPSHPMAGTENSGPNAALHGLFDRKTAVICDQDQSDERHLKVVEKMYQALEMRLIYMPSNDHDLHVAYVSHLSHISSFVLANTVLAKEQNATTIFDLAGGGFESTVRLAKSSPAMWEPIFEQNRENVTEALEAYIEQLKAFHYAMANGQSDKTKALMENANRIRPVLADIGARNRKEEK